MLYVPYMLCADWFLGVVLALLSDGVTLYLMLTVAVLAVGGVVGLVDWFVSRLTLSACWVSFEPFHFLT